MVYLPAQRGWQLGIGNQAMFKAIQNLVYFVVMQSTMAIGVFHLCEAIEMNAPSSIITFAGLLTGLGFVGSIGCISAMKVR
jgi:hypothetical protein